MSSQTIKSLYDFVMTDQKVISLEKFSTSYEQVQQIRYLHQSKLQFRQQAENMERLARTMRESERQVELEVEKVLQKLAKSKRVMEEVGAL